MRHQRRGLELKAELSKSERDDRHARSEGGTGAQPVMAAKLHLKRRSTCAQAFSAILTSTAEQTVANRQAVLETDDPEAAHQLRVGLRRLRSALRALRPLVGARSLREFERSARDVARCVGTLRDSDVLIGSLHGSVAPDERGLAELSKALARHRRLKRDEVRSALRGAAWNRLEPFLLQWPHKLEEMSALSRPIRSYARKALRNRWRKTTKYGRALDQLSPEQRHEMRKVLKELRYSAEFFASLFRGRDTRRFIKQLKALQDIFGYMNDARIIAPQLHAIAGQRSASREAAVCAGYVAGRHDAEAVHVWRRAGRAWRQLEASRRFWRK